MRGRFSEENCICHWGKYRRSSWEGYECVLCPAGSTNSGHSVSVNDCKCKPGFRYTGPTAGSCALYPAGKFNGMSDNHYCHDCHWQTNVLSTVPGSTSKSDCHCVTGKYWSVSCRVCGGCAAGKYRAFTGFEQTECDDCPANMTTDNWNNVNIAACQCVSGYSHYSC